MLKYFVVPVLTLLVLSELVAGYGITKLDCTRPHEEYQCGSACQNECATLGQHCPIVNIRCNDACYCIQGYARDSSGTCIPEADCSKNASKLECTKPNEEYHCGSACQNECGKLGQACPIINKRCNNACYCIKGYARDDTGRCIPESDCLE